MADMAVHVGLAHVTVLLLLRNTGSIAWLLGGRRYQLNREVALILQVVDRLKNASLPRERAIELAGELSHAGPASCRLALQLTPQAWEELSEQRVNRVANIQYLLSQGRCRSVSSVTNPDAAVVGSRGRRHCHADVQRGNLFAGCVGHVLLHGADRSDLAMTDQAHAAATLQVLGRFDT